MNKRMTYGNRLIEEREIARKQESHRTRRDVRVNSGWG